MVFKRRDKPPFWSRLRQWVAPRKGWRRGFEYLGHRVKRLPDSPHRIAIGLAAGTFVSFSPFFGFHFVYAALVAFVLRGNIVAGLIGTAVGNPLTFPAIAASALGLGRLILGGRHSAVDFGQVMKAFGDFFGAIWTTISALWGQGHYALDHLGPFLREVFLPYLLGGTISGALAGIAVYFLSRPVIAAYQNRRRMRLMERARRKVHAHFKRPVPGADPAE
ncbi:MAG: DUF2062 domain-containing protein [Alphaproteobacteria bacterium]|nr:MAG: DUF2062 domain-containing protein [Alphaproteobacteria bacterium]